MKRTSILFCIVINLYLAVQLHAQGGTITTIAGTHISGYNGQNIQATASQIYYPYGICIDAAGNIFIDQWGNHIISKINTAGIITTISGTAGSLGYSGDGGPALAAQEWGPYETKMDAAGNLYFADANDNAVRKITMSTGIITTIAGNGISGSSGDGGAATAAELNYPTGVVVDQLGNVFIADQYNNQVREVNASTGVITTIAGTGVPGYSGDGGSATNAELSGPAFVAVDKTGNVYFSENINHIIRKVNVSTNTISTIAGIGVAGYSGDCGPATKATMNDPAGLVFDNAGNLFISDAENNVIREVYTNGIIITYAGNGIQGYSGNGGPAISAELYHPVDLIFDASGDLLFDDDLNMVIRKIAPGTSSTSNITTSSANPSTCSGCDGTAGVTISGSASGATYLWSNGETSQNITNLCSGTYTITVSEGCSVLSDTVTITSPANTVTALTDPLQTENVSCFGGKNGTATVSASGGTPPYTYAWNPTGNSTQTATQLTAGSYVVTIKDSSGCSTNTTITITQPTELSSSILSTNAACGGNGGTAMVNVSGGIPPYLYLWTPGSSTTNSISNLNPGSYLVKVTDSNRCIAADSIVIITVAPDFTITGQDSVCYGSSATLTVEGVTDYLWSTGATTSSITISPLTSTTYSVVVSDKGQCKDTLTNTVIVDSLPTVGVCCDTVIYIGQSIPLLATGGNTFEWNPSAGLTCDNCPDPSAKPATNTVYTVTVANKYGCKATDSVLIRTEPCAGIYIPNAFSPNGDKLNATFEPKGDCIYNYTINIFDKWGQLVYKNTASQPWNGTYNNNGIVAQEDTYVYQLTISTYNSIPQTFIGRVTLLK